MKPKTQNPKPKTKTPRPAARPRNPERDRFNRIMDLVLDDYGNARAWNEKMESDNVRLIFLTRGVAAVGEGALLLVHGVRPQRNRATRELQKTLVGITGFCLAWLTLDRPSALSQAAAIEHIFLQLAHRHTMFLRGELTFDLNSPSVDPPRKFRVVLNRLGSVVRALQCDWPEKVHPRIVALAAVCLAWLESFDRVKKPTTPNP